jgi:hypothetical protein
MKRWNYTRDKEGMIKLPAPTPLQSCKTNLTTTQKNTYFWLTNGSSVW